MINSQENKIIKVLLFSSYYELIVLPVNAIAEILFFDPDKVKPVSSFSILIGYYEWKNKMIPIINLGFFSFEQSNDPHLTRIVVLYFPEGYHVAVYFNGLPKIMYLTREDVQSRIIAYQDENGIAHHGVTIAGLDVIIPNVQACFNRLLPLLHQYRP